MARTRRLRDSITAEEEDQGPATSGAGTGTDPGDPPLRRGTDPGENDPTPREDTEHENSAKKMPECGKCYDEDFVCCSKLSMSIFFCLHSCQYL